jgi:membrane protein
MLAYAKQEYSTSLIVLRETLAGFTKHNILGLSASLSFYALFALIPLMLMMFFLLSHLIFSSSYALVKLAILSGNLVPEFSNKIMLEVYSASKTKATLGFIELLLLIWTITPLASAMRASFFIISSKREQPSFFKRKFKDVLSVLGILMLFFLFTSAGFAIENAVRFLSDHLPESQINLIGGLITLLLTSFLISIFYILFFPMRIAIKNIVIGAFFTSLLWLLMRFAFGLFLSLDQNYGAVFGSMKNMFISISWLYFYFAAFLLGSELIASLSKKDVFLLKSLFDNLPNNANYIDTLMQRYGMELKQGHSVYNVGNYEGNLYYVVEGQINLLVDNKVIREVLVGEYFGVMEVLTKNTSLTE